jgi:hypothetical protein
MTTRRSSLSFSVPALLIAAALCVLALLSVPPLALGALGLASFGLLSFGFARAMVRREHGYVPLAVPLLALLMLLGAAASFADHRTQADASRPFINAPPTP